MQVSVVYTSSVIKQSTKTIIPFHFVKDKYKIFNHNHSKDT